jgi:hypothetical protein
MDNWGLWTRYRPVGSLTNMAVVHGLNRRIVALMRDRGKDSGDIDDKRQNNVTVCGKVLPSMRPINANNLTLKY